MTDRHRYHLRLDPDLREALELLAAVRGASMQALIHDLLSEAAERLLATPEVKREAAARIDRLRRQAGL